MVNDPFVNVVGQEKTKRKLSFYIEGYKRTGIFPNSILVAPKGCGKTLIAKAIGRSLLLPESSNPKSPLIINCSTVKNTRQFVNQVVVQHMVGKYATIIFDEASELPKDLSMALLTILNPNPENKNTFRFDDFNYEFDFKKHTFLFATTEAQHVFHALMDRLERIELEDYSNLELAKIVVLALNNGFHIEDLVVEEVIENLRGNARAAQRVGEKINLYLASKNKSTLGKPEWEDLKNILGILPLGISPIELKLLKILAVKPDGGFSLTQLSSMTEMSRQSLQQDIERYLLKHMFMEINTMGRCITKKGLEYLNKLETKRGKQKVL